MGRSISVHWVAEGVQQLAHAVTDLQGNQVVTVRDGQRFVSKCVHELHAYRARGIYGHPVYYMISKACKHNVVFAERGTPIELINKLLEDGSI